MEAALGARAGTTDRRRATRDVWQLLLDLATADLPGHRAARGAALRSELAAVEPPAGRRRFALGGVWTTATAGGAALGAVLRPPRGVN
ncbi:hypothetical protein ACFYYN_01485 [Streptomyces sp. NPDC001902]